jgi:arginyl-tRNA synthetase
MSSRTGDVVTAVSLIEKIKAHIKEKFLNEVSTEDEKIAIGAIKYSILRQSSGDDIVFDIDKSVSFEGDSGPYLQYAAVRANSIGGKAKAAKIKESVKDFPAEVHSLEKMLCRFPEIVERAAGEYEPHHITTYLTELAGFFNNYYANNQIISAEDKNSPYRIALTHAFAIVMKNGLNLLGIETPAKM